MKMATDVQLIDKLTIKKKTKRKKKKKKKWLCKHPLYKEKEDLNLPLIMCMLTKSIIDNAIYGYSS